MECAQSFPVGAHFNISLGFSSLFPASLCLFAFPSRLLRLRRIRSEKTEFSAEETDGYEINEGRWPEKRRLSRRKSCLRESHAGTEKYYSKGQTNTSTHQKKQLGNANYLYFFRFSCFVYPPVPDASSDAAADHLSRISPRQRLPKMSRQLQSCRRDRKYTQKSIFCRASGRKKLMKNKINGDSRRSGGGRGNCER